jgi:hypothetical protein
MNLGAYKRADSADFAHGRLCRPPNEPARYFPIGMVQCYEDEYTTVILISGRANQVGHICSGSFSGFLKTTRGTYSAYLEFLVFQYDSRCQMLEDDTCKQDGSFGPPA